MKWPPLLDMVKLPLLSSEPFIVKFCPLAEIVTVPFSPLTVTLFDFEFWSQPVIAIAPAVIAAVSTIRIVIPF